MKTIKMLKTMKGSQDGVTVATFEKGNVCTIADPLADVFLSEKWAMLVKTEDPKDIETPEDPKPAGPGKTKKTKGK